MFLRLVLANSLFSLRDINLTLGLLPPRRHVVWRDSVGVESSGSGLEIRVRGYFSSQLSLVVAPYWRAPKRAKQLSMATIPLSWVLSVSCWCVAELIFWWYDQHCSILLAEFNMSTSGRYRSYVLRHIRLRSYAVLCGSIAPTICKDSNHSKLIS